MSCAESFEALPVQPSKRLWDSATCLAWLQDEKGADLCQATLDAAGRGEVQIYISTMAIAETLMVKGKPPLSKESKLKVRGFFKRPEIIPIELDRYCAEVAQELVWDYKIKPKDAIHVASALLAECDIVETFDKDLQKRSGRVGGTPPLQILEPGKGLNLSLLK